MNMDSFIDKLISNLFILSGKITGTKFKSIMQSLKNPDYRSKFTQHILQPNLQLLKQNKRNRSVFLILGGKGIVQVYHHEVIGGKQERIRKAALKTPCIIGEMSLITNGYATADVIIENHTVYALEIGLNQFHELIQEIGLLEEFLAITYQRIKELDIHREYLSSKEASLKINSIKGHQRKPIQKLILQELSEFSKKHPAEKSFYMQHYKKNSYIIDQFIGNKSTFSDDMDVHIILAGEVAVYKSSPAREMIFLGLLKPGEIFGEMAMFMEIPYRTANVVANTNTLVLGISAKKLAFVLKDNPDLYANLQTLIQQRQQSQGKKIRTLSEHSDTVKYFTPEILQDINSIKKQIYNLNKLGYKSQPEDKWNIIARSERGVVTVDNNGKLVWIEISIINARQVLARLIMEELQDKQERYALRRECLYHDPEIDTVRAYTKGAFSVRSFDDSLENKIYQKKALQKAASWTKERLAFHEKLKNSWKKIIIEGHVALLNLQKTTEKPILILLSGNTGVGKSYVLKNLSKICPRFHEFYINMNYIINPDRIKNQIQKNEGFNEDNTLKVSSYQTHFEGTQITEELIKWGMKNNYNMIIDKRFLTNQEVQEINNPSMRKNYYFIMVDINASLETSLDRVFGNPEKGVIGRDPEGVESIPPRSVIVEGYKLAISHRLEKSLFHEIDEYYLIENESDNPVLIAERSGNTSLSVLPGFLAITSYAMRDIQYDPLIEKCLNNFSKMSRSAIGLIDTSASPGKHKIFKQLDEESIKNRTNLNLKGTLAWVFQQRPFLFQDEKELRQFIENIALRINETLVKPEASLYRNEDSPVYPYTKIKDLETAMQKFCSMLYAKLYKQHSDPIEVAAWVEYRADLCDHFFADGCGRIAKVLSIFVLFKAHGKNIKLPDYTDRVDYYSHAPKTDNEAIREEQFSSWLKYYKNIAKE